ncbi:DUF29 family protein [Methylobacterium sp. NEAU K]|uniref:DUF29 family protein n=1 Tax=Methylobacterium sp. NEAU K TaxID=3064946 RepID=UPI002732F380|nr:DUF29 family protein [Methylobacterium sp. NEAU K]MDP4003088.1 DUF29 family protein [Methylobacterium sp. NEAU K]
MRPDTVSRSRDLASENLAEGIESSGKRRFASPFSDFRVALLQMLRVDHQPAARTRNWALPIPTHRNHAADEFEEGPGQEARSGEAIAKACRRARRDAAKESCLPLKRFPETGPYTYQDIRDRPFAIDTDS